MDFSRMVNRKKARSELCACANTTWDTDEVNTLHISEW